MYIALGNHSSTFGNCKQRTSKPPPYGLWWFLFASSRSSHTLTCSSRWSRSHQRPGCAPAAHTTRSGPRAAASAAEIKEKETKHHGKRSSPFKTPKKKKTAPSPRLPPPPFRGWWERSQGGGEFVFSLPRAPPPPPTHASSTGTWMSAVENGGCFPARSPLTLNCTLLLCFSQVLPVPPSHPASQVSPSQLLPRRSPLLSRSPSGETPSGTWLWPASALRRWSAGRSSTGHPSPRLPPLAPGASRHTSAPVPRSQRKKRGEKKRSENSSGPWEHPSPEALLSRTSRGH